jgi:hypothetical protein
MSNTNETTATTFTPNTGAVLIEIANQPAGIALPDGGAYRFIAVDPRFRILDGSRFKKPIQAEIAARNLFAALGSGQRNPALTRSVEAA